MTRIATRTFAGNVEPGKVSTLHTVESQWAEFLKNNFDDFEFQGIQDILLESAPFKEPEMYNLKIVCEVRLKDMTGGTGTPPPGNPPPDMPILKLFDGKFNGIFDGKKENDVDAAMTNYFAQIKLQGGHVLDFKTGAVQVPVRYPQRYYVCGAVITAIRPG